MDILDTTFLAALLFAYVLYRQCITRPVTRRDFILPAIGAAYLTIRYLDQPVNVTSVAIEAAATIGIASGLVTGGLVQVWRDRDSGLVYQYGGWRYAVVLLGLLVIRLLWRETTDMAGITAGVNVLNDAFVAATLGNYLGRTVHVAIRALHLAGWDPRAIPRNRDARRLISSRPK